MVARLGPRFGVESKVGGQDSTCNLAYSLGKDENSVVDSVSNPRSVVKIRHATLLIPQVRMGIWSSEWVRDSVLNPRSVDKIRHATLVIAWVRMGIRS